MHIRKALRTRARRLSSLFPVTALAAVTLTILATADAATPRAKPKPRLGGTVITALNLEPPSLNFYLGVGAPLSTSIVSNQVLAQAYRLGPAGEVVPDLIVGDPEITTAPFSLTYTIKKEARWSDGVPVTARDFVFTWQLLARSTFKIPDDTRELYGEIVRAKKLGPKRVRFVFREPFPAWKDLFAPVLPQHALAGEDFDKVWRDRIDNPKTDRPIASGAFIFESWEHGSRLTLTRNRNYWAKKAYLDRLVFRFLLPDFGAQIRAVRAGEVDLIQPLGAVPVSDLRSSPGIQVQSGSTEVWEQIAFQLGAKGNPALKNPFVRQAIAYAIDRRSLTNGLSREFAPGLKTDQSAVYLPYQRGYRPHWRIWSYNPQKAIRLLRSHGCRRGGDGIFSCQGRRLSFRLLSTTGDVLRERTFDLVQPELRRIGVDLVQAFGPRQLLSTLLKQGDWDLALFSWFGVSSGIGDEKIWGCKGDFNPTGYCNRRVTTLLRRASAELRPSLRTPLVNRADALMARDLPMLPLFVRPGYVIYNSRIRNVKWNLDALWNAQDWWIAPR